MGDDVRYRAIIFDLYGTLVDDLRYPDRQEVKYLRWSSEAACILGVRSEDFVQAWSDTVLRQSVGEIKTSREAYALICDDLNVDVSDGQLERAVARGLKYVYRALTPRAGVLESLASLRDDGVKIGLISNCLSDTSMLWPSTPLAPLFDVAVLSYEVGLMKPDPGIYALACNRLGVEPNDCLFIGDGGSGELTGATNVGMDAVLIRAPDDTENGDREDWRGARISSVAEVLGLLS